MYLAEDIKNIIEKGQDESTGNFCNIEEGFTGIISDFVVCILKAEKDGWYNGSDKLSNGRLQEIRKNVAGLSNTNLS